MRSMFLFLSMTAACAAGSFEPLGFSKPPAARPPEPIITNPSGGIGAGGAFSKVPGGLIGPGGMMMETGGGFIDPRGQFRPRIGPPPEFFGKPAPTRRTR